MTLEDVCRESTLRTSPSSGQASVNFPGRGGPEDAALIRRWVWVRRQRDGSSPQFDSAAERQQRSRYRS